MLVATGTAVKVVTVNQEDRSIGEFVDDAIIKTVIKNAYFDQNENYFLILMSKYHKPECCLQVQ